MSSARILLAAVALGLTACAHTPSSDSSFYMPDLRTAAPVRMMDGAAIDGLDDHLIIIVDPAGIEQVNRQTRVDPFAQLYYLGALQGNGHRPSAQRPVSSAMPDPVATRPSTQQTIPRSSSRNESFRTRSRR